MSPTRIILFTLLCCAGLFGYFKLSKEKKSELPSFVTETLTELEAVDEVDEVIAAVEYREHGMALEPTTLVPHSDESALPKEVDQMAALFQPYPPLLPFIKTVDYSSKVDWLTNRSAYLGDYAAHYKTSTHFISRSLHGMGNYLSQVVSKGDRFNVIDPDTPVEFHLVLDLSRLKMWVYYLDTASNTRGLLKSYYVGAGKLDHGSASGCLTPCGTFMLGSEIAIYSAESRGTRFGREIDMISVFGQRWIPLAREVAACTASCKGLGIQGAPWVKHPETGEFYEDRASIGHYLSGGCIRLLSEDIAELFSVIISRPSYVHIVKDFVDAVLPGSEV